MRDPIPHRWLPVDTILGVEVSAATDAALAPLAAQARRMRRSAILGTALLLGSAVALAILSAGSGRAAWAVAAVAAATFGGILAYQTQRVWSGDAPRIGQRDRTISVPDLPQASAALLADLRAGVKRARYRRAQSGRDVVLPPQQLRGPFGPLILSSLPEVQSLALRDWFGSDQLSIEIETVVHELPMPGDTPTSATDGKEEAAANPLGLDPRLLLTPAALAHLLDRVYPPVSRGTRECLIVDALMLGNELVHSALMPGKVKTLVSRIVAGLKASDGCPVNLRADDGTVAQEQYVFRHRKILASGYGKVGLREGSDSTTWIEQTVTGRYLDIKERLDAEDGRHRTP
jgi:hypothetical protein